jgi:hypothetical protein
MRPPGDDRVDTTSTKAVNQTALFVPNADVSRPILADHGVFAGGTDEWQ